MEVLKLLQQWRTPFGDFVVDLVTHLGGEVFFMLVGLVLLWCVNKQWGFRLLIIGMAGTSFNQLLKGIFCIPRPWILDPTFEIVESARSGATGYSFPSGHTQSAVSVFVTLAMLIRKKWVAALCVLLVVTVGFSRMYLGVHTPMDVGVSLVLGSALVLLMNAGFDRAQGSNRKTGCMLAGAVMFAALVLLYLCVGPKSEKNVAEFDMHGVESMGKMLGASLGLMLAWFVDAHYTHFETKAPLWAQVVKVLLGAALVVGVKSGLKPAIVSLLGDHAFADGARYFLIAVVGGVVWPMTFKWFQVKTSAAVQAK